MIKPLLLAGLAALMLGSATAAQAHGDSRNDRRSSGRGGCDTRSRYSNSRDGGRYRQSRHGGPRYGYSGRDRDNDRGRWNDGRRDYRGRDRVGSRDLDWDDDRDGRDRVSEWDDDRFELDNSPTRPRFELAPQSNRVPNAPRRTPVTGVARRPAS